MAMTARDLLAAVRQVVPEVGAEAVHARLACGGHVLIDVRERAEYEAGHLPGAIHISKSYIEVLLEERVPDRQTPITLYCAGGTRSLLAAESVMRLGYSNVESMVDGVGGWKAHGYELVREEAPLLGLARSA
ncbi:MAG: sulfur-carrier protein adenylyltransferase/sulfurtransferase [Chloroflexota bacterium]|jgi:adenylyltransferase/sulfurtransferase|nr:sulfur-carrier protein adenylyltransferase/sulfurtransferase [Chloroflexota bacterium]